MRASFRVAAGFVLILGLASAAVGAAGEDDESEKPASRGQTGGVWETLGEDGRYLLTFPKRRTRKGTAATAAVLGGIGVLIALDDEIRREVQEARNDTLDRWESRIEPLGRTQTTSVSALLIYAAGRLSDSPGVTETGASLIEALFFTEAFKTVGKGLTARLPPGPDTRASDFFSGGTIFPSGNTARAFAFATVLAERHGRRAAWIGYPLATLVGLFRVESDIHWASDVLAGAALGWAVGKTVVRRRAARAAEREAAEARQLTVLPVLSPGRREVGVVVRYSF